MITRLILVLILGLSSWPFEIVVAQDLGQIGKKGAIKLSGGVSANQIFYASAGQENRRNPYTYFLSGNLNVNIIEFSLPVSFTFSNQSITLQQPFNQFILHPKYKWLTAHIGYTSMSFSPYTLGGHIFLGAGIEAAPQGKWKCSAMYGRFLKAVQYDSSDKRNQPAFERWGYGFKTHYGDQKAFADFILFRAKDKINSLPDVPEVAGVWPQENLALSMGGGATFFKKIQVKYEISGSAITSDIRAEKSNLKNLYSYTGPLFRPRTSTAYYKAMKSSLNYSGNGYGFGIAYERIDPGYKTLGAYFFNNDLENISINGSTALAGGKVTVGASVGRQRDNLDNSKVSTLKRTVSSLTVGFTPSKNLNISTSYSNFTSFTNRQSPFTKINRLTPYDNLDTLNYIQLSQNLNASAAYTIRAEKNRQSSANMTISLMTTSDKQGGKENTPGTTFVNFNAGYNYIFTEKKLTISPTFNLSKNTGAASSFTAGPTVTVSKSLGTRQTRVSATANANRSYADSKYISQVITLRGSCNYTLLKKHNLTLSLVSLNRTGRGIASFTEFTGTLGYSYSFN